MNTQPEIWQQYLEGSAERKARRAEREAQTYSQLSKALDRPAEVNHAGPLAMEMVHAALAHYDLSGEYDLRYGGMRRSSGNGTHGISEGFVTIEARLRSVSGVDTYVDIPLLVRSGRLLPPEYLVHDGQLRVLAQSTFDDLFASHTIYDLNGPREQGKWVTGQRVLKTNGEVEMRTRGGAVERIPSGTEVTFIRDMMGDGKIFIVQLPDNRIVPLDACCLS